MSKIQADFRYATIVPLSLLPIFSLPQMTALLALPSLRCQSFYELSDNLFFSHLSPFTHPQIASRSSLNNFRQIQSLANFPSEPMAVGVCEAGSWPSLPVRASKRRDLVLLREGIDITTEYFNAGEREHIPVLTEKARKWCGKYYKGYHYAPTRATGLLQVFPNLFNLSVEGT